MIIKFRNFPEIECTWLILDFTASMSKPDSWTPFNSFSHMTGYVIKIPIKHLRRCWHYITVYWQVSQICCVLKKEIWATELTQLSNIILQYAKLKIDVSRYKYLDFNYRKRNHILIVTQSSLLCWWKWDEQFCVRRLIYLTSKVSYFGNKLF